jgi:hypothetical protein
MFGVGLDIGTMNIISSRKNEADDLVVKRIRDAFLDLDLDAKKMLKLTKVSYIEYSDKIIIVGDNALNTANILKKDARRPLSKGIISPSEIDAVEVLSVMIKQVLGKPQKKDEVCYYSVPAAPVDDPTRDVIYHAKVFSRIVEDLGYKAIESNEALAIIFSNCAEDGFSGLAFSYGSGMVNIALSYHTLMSMSCSISKGGDWIDTQAGKALNLTASKMCSIKEKGINLLDPKDRTEEAISIYYKSLIEESIHNMVEQVNNLGDSEFPEAIPIILSGGTSQAQGFLELYKSIFKNYKDKLKLDISEIRMANNPLTSVSEGLLLQALQDSED